MKNKLSKEEKERRKNKVKGFTVVPPSKNAANRTLTMNLSKKGLKVQYILANHVTKDILDEEKKPMLDESGNTVQKIVLYEARKITHDPKAEKYNKFVLDLKKLGATEEYINKVTVTHFGK